MQRTIVPQGRYFSQELAPGLFHEAFYPGGKEGPNREVRLPTPGGQTWSEAVVLGSEADPFQTLVPDIRLPANQLWPLHWHDCWTLVLVLEGGCGIGDWWFGEGDVFLTVPELEYGPLLIGPQGCRMWEIFAQAHLAAGGYSPEYRDHPTLQNSNHAFRERSPLNRRNDGRQSLPCDGVDSIWKLRLEPGLVIDLGEAGDSERTVLRDTRLKPGQALPPSITPDWRMIAVLDGSVDYRGRSLVRDDYLRVAPGASVETICAGPGGAQLVEVGRTARALPGLT